MRNRSGDRTVRVGRSISLALLLRLGPAAVLCAGALASAGISGALPAHAAGVTYALTDLGTLGGMRSQAYAINAGGQVVGVSETAPSSGGPHAFIWSAGSGMTDLGNLGQPPCGTAGSTAFAINASGQVAGDSTAADNSCTGIAHSFLWSSGTGIVDLDAGGSRASDSNFARGINGSGDVVGFGAVGSNDTALLYTGPGQVEDLSAALPAGSGWAYLAEATAINDSGLIAGDGFFGTPGHPTGDPEGFVWDPIADPASVPTSVPGIDGGTGARIYAVNANGTVVGLSGGTSGPEHAFMSNPSRFGYLTRDLGTLPGDRQSQAQGINDLDQVVGTSGGTDIGGSDAHAFVYSNGVMTDLNTLIPSGTGWLLNNATAINDAGQIVGYGTIGGITFRAFLLTPVSTDTSPPVITPHVSPSPSASGWNTSGPVSVTWDVSDPESGIQSTAGCGTSTVDSDTTGTTFTCSATNGAGLQSSQSVTVKLDATGPQVSCPSADGAWHGANVTLDCTVSDATSGLAPGTPNPVLLSTTVAGGQETANASTGSTTVCDVAGNCSPVGPIPGTMIDRKAPTVTASAASDGASYSPGTWTNHSVIVHFVCTDGGSGVASVTPDTTVSIEGVNQTVTGTCTDNTGNTAGVTVANIDIDLTPPSLGYSGNAGTYTVADMNNITCSASDALSGIAGATCANIAGPAYSFGLGSHTFLASATDRAGNMRSASTTFTVGVTFDSLCSLARSFSSDSDVADGLCAKLASAKASAARGNTNAEAGQIGAFKNQVAAQSGKALSADQAQMLTNLANALM